MIQELSNKVWANALFHEASQRVELAWLARELGVEPTDAPKETDPLKLMQSAAILACSETRAHRLAAYRIATCTYELFGKGILPLDQGLRVVLSRLSNFPSLFTRGEVFEALASLPLAFASESIALTDSRAVTVNKEVHHLTNFQFGLWKALNDGEGIAIAAPTSAGKSFVLQSYIQSLYESSEPCVVVYVVPTRALIAQVAGDLTFNLSDLGEGSPEILTVPIDATEKLKERAIYVMTQERVQLVLSAQPLFKADVVIVDEAHAIADGARGVLLQWVVDDLLERNPALQLLFASPSIRNLDVFRRLFGVGELAEFSSIEPTVAQNFLIVKVESAPKGLMRIQRIDEGNSAPLDVATIILGQTMASRIEKLVHAAVRLGQGQSNIIYADGADDAEKIAMQLADLLSERVPTEAQLAIVELAKEVVHPSYVLVECVKRGVAFHYANIPTQLRRAIEEGASVGAIDYLVCTSTLLQGVNLPAKNIFMCLPKKGRGNALDSTDFWNLAGRAGRLRREFHGNIFLIDYEKWEKKPLEGPKDALITPAMFSAISERGDELIDIITNSEKAVTGDTIDLEAAFVRLYSDLKRDGLASTFDKIGLAADAPQKATILAALEEADKSVTVPSTIIRRAANISAHKQQRLFDQMRETIAVGSPDALRSLIPRHPRESDAFESYSEIFRVCHEVILGIDTSKNLHRFHALMALRWMRGISLPQIIDFQIKRRPKQQTRTTIRGTLDVIETQVRFQAVRIVGCYTNLLAYALELAGRAEMIASIPSLPLYLELGASDRTMISFISLGLSRVTAMKLNELSARKDFDVAAARNWLQTRPMEQLGLSPLLLEEVRGILGSKV